MGGRAEMLKPRLGKAEMLGRRNENIAKALLSRRWGLCPGPSASPPRNGQDGEGGVLLFAPAGSPTAPSPACIHSPIWESQHPCEPQPQPALACGGAPTPLHPPSAGSTQ